MFPDRMGSTGEQAPGFWEERSYSSGENPWKEERYSY